MNENLITFLKKEPVGVLTVKMPDGTLNGATLHYGFDEKNFSFVFMTSPTYKKAIPLQTQEETEAALVIGFSEDEMKTVQLSGVARLGITDEAKENYQDKFPEKDLKYTKDIFFTFVPKVWRYTDWNMPAGKTVLNDQGEIIILD